MLLVKKNSKRVGICSALLVLQAIVDLVFSVIFDMTDQYFDFGMFNLRNDAFGILESIPVNFVTFYAGLFFCVLYIVYGSRILKRDKKITQGKRSKWYSLGVAALGLIMTTVSLFAYNPLKTDKYEEMLNGKQTSAYASYGMIGNFVNELANATVFKKRQNMSSEQVENFIYAEESKPTQHFGVSKGNNVVVVLVESFEWFSFIADEIAFNRLPIEEEQLAELFPNLTKFYNSSVVGNNFHSREKTDIAETLSIMGCYPTDSYVNYNYDENVMPQTMPILLKELEDANIQARSFHNGFKTFYNRKQVHDSFGFESLTDMYDMEKMSQASVANGGEQTFVNSMVSGTRNLDYEMINTCKDLMFPTDKRFYTFITTITMHGVYYERENLALEQERLSAIYPLTEESTEEEELLWHYVSTVINFDRALGCMMEDLEKKGLLDNTTIVLYGDHNTYYHDLSNYVKDIHGYETENCFTDLYRVPLMIYDQNLEHEVINKFACTADIVPTLLDLLGIKYFSNVYFGNSLFSQKESVLYSRAYDYFLRKGIIGRSVNSILYRNDELVTFAAMESFKRDATALVEKIRYCDFIFEEDYFANRSHYKKYFAKMKELNS